MSPQWHSFTFKMGRIDRLVVAEEEEEDEEVIDNILRVF